MKSKKYRIEIISNQSVQDDITELLEQEIPEIEYTVIPVVHGTAPVRFARYLPVSVEPVRGFSGLFENAVTATFSGSCP